MQFSYLKSQIIGISIIAAWVSLLLYSLTQTIPAWLASPIVILQTFLSVGLFITAHDSMHDLISKNNKVNDLYGQLTLYLYAAFSFKKLKKNHIKHHQSPVSETDPDYHHNESFFIWFSNFIKNYYHLREFLLMHLHVLVLLWISGGNYPKVLLFYALPSILSALQLFYFGTYLTHRTNEKHQNRHNARSNNYPVWISFLTCYHFGYHFEHHEYPDTPWWALPQRRVV